MKPTLDLLLVEDNPGDALLTQEALGASGTTHRVRVSIDGEDALVLLRQALVDDDLPDLVVLDVSLPGRSGHEVLELIKADEVLGRLPVVMFSSSDDDRDVRRSYELHSAFHVTKPVDLDGYREAVVAVEHLWRSTATLPARRSG